MLSRLRGRRVLIDSNLLVLFCVGMSGPSYIARHKRLREFDATDFELLRGVVEAAEQLRILPNIATETSNLIRHFALPDRDRFSEVLKEAALTFAELPVASEHAVEQLEYARLGLTDAAILWALDEEKDLTLLTSDLDLYLAAARLEFEAVNFNHLRELRPDFR